MKDWRIFLAFGLARYWDRVGYLAWAVAIAACTATGTVPSWADRFRYGVPFGAATAGASLALSYGLARLLCRAERRRIVAKARKAGLI